ncbi:MAG: AEC family transporter [Patescibacteria group bacterium]|jgi:hypothetical protein
MLTIMLPIAGLILLGYILGRFKLISPTWIGVFNNYGYYIGLPALVFNSLAFATIQWQQYSLIFLIQIILGAALMLLAHFIGGKQRNTYSIGIYFSNAGYVGIPILQMALGTSAAAEGTVIVAAMVVMTSTLGLGLMSHVKIKHLLTNPLLWLTIVGFLVSACQFVLPDAIIKLSGMVAATASPIAMLALGAFMAYNHPKKSTLKIAARLTFAKMIIVPLVVGIIIWLLPNSQWLNTTFIQVCMPVAVTAFAFAEIYPIDKSTISNAIVLSTLTSLVTIPLALWLLPML